ncbi:MULTISPECIES: LamG domain-containing protein [unclassified Streptomyces]|uniref:LamG domain-containing protein n=1 Tax=unclassified Streptomyces TaxID=2593676 RepID=UPI00386BC74E
MGAALVAGYTPAPAFGVAVLKAPGTTPAAKQSADQSASARAAASGQPVEVVEERTEYATTMANPDGTFTLTQSTRPQRARAKDGSWRGIDITLERRSDGTVGPKSAVVDLAFSGGGSAKPVITLGGKRGSLSLGWPGALPEPQLSGATAIYPEVFKGVDLKLTATAEGYREVLVVKSAEAAANSELERIKLTVKGDGLDVAPGAGGGLRAIDADGNAAFTGPAGVMWDSAGDAGAAPQLVRATAEAEKPEPSKEDPNRPGAGDASAELPVQVDGNAVAVRPDLELLRGEKTVYPVFIDPPMGAALQERTVLSSDGDRFWNFDGDYGVGNCSHLGPWYCGRDYTNRMYFEFAPTNLAGKYVVDAVFRAHETWSFSCTPHEVDLWRSNNISEGTRWPGPGQLDLMGDRNVSAGRGTNCTPEQPDSWVEFHDNAAEGDENLTSTVRSFADGKFSRLTLMLRAKDESDPDAWKRFDDNAALTINYVPKPGTPVPVGVIPGTGTVSECARDYRSPEAVTVLTPTVVAGAQALVQPASNGFKGSLRVVFQAHRSDGSTWHNTWGPETMPEAPAYSPDGTLLSKQMTQRQEGTLYRVRAVTQSFWTHEGVTQHMDSAPTDWCYFKVDTTLPKAPVITGGSPYKECVTGGQCEELGGPGVTATFSFAPNAADSDIKAYLWRWHGEKAATKVLLSQAKSVLLTPPDAGIQTLEVRATDVRDRWGEPAIFKINVAEAEGPIGRWRFDDGEGTDRTSPDSAEAGATRHDSTLYTGGALWDKRARRGAGDFSLGVNSEDPAQQQGYAATTEQVVNTRDSFTVSGWAYLTDTSANQVVLSAPGDQDTAFTLYYSSGRKRWAFNRGAQDKSTTPDVISEGDTVNPPAGVWTHLAGVFNTGGNTDKADDTIQLFVNGIPQGTAPVKLSEKAPEYEPWTSTHGLQFGRTKAAGAFQQYFHGYLDEVSVWRYALNEHALLQEARLLKAGGAETELVARWDAVAATGGEVTDKSEYKRAAMKLSAGAVLGGDDNALVLDGKAGSASTNGPVVDESGSFTVSARVKLNPAELATKPDGYQAQVAGQRASATSGESSWALWLVKIKADAYQWRFTRTVIGTDGKATQTAEATPRTEFADVSATADWVDVTGVFDAHEEWQWADADDPDKTASGRGKLHLFVVSEDKDVRTNPGLTASQQGSGELTMGRGSGGGSTGHYLPGKLQLLRVWTGAMSADQVGEQVVNSDSPV